MSAEQLTTRIAAEQSGIESNELRRGNIKEDQFMHYARTISDLNLFHFILIKVDLYQLECFLQELED